jgi:hypothetical protein
VIFGASGPQTLINQQSMKISSIILVAALGLFAVGCKEQAEDTAKAEAVALFNGENLDGWNVFLVEDGVKKEDVWSAKDGVLVTKGEPLGYLFTTDSFENFKLTLDWRWEGEPGNSGVLLRIAGDAKSFLPKCAEAQLKNGSAGDIWAFYGAKVEGDEARFKDIKDHEKLGNFQGVGHIKDAEKPAGEWNTYEITMSGGDLTLKVNGELVNEAKGLDVLAGPIGLQSEGGVIHFRNIKLEKL